MAYTAEYWDGKEKRARKAQEWTQKMAKQYPAAIKRAVAETITYSENHCFHEFDLVNHHMEIVIEDLDSVSAIKKEAKTIEMENTGQRLAVLNFASYRNPGGMFLKGSKAQEECLCHESFLYNVLRDKPEYYMWNNIHRNNAMSTNRALYTPNVVFGGATSGRPCDVITCAAPNKSAAMKYKGVTDEENSNYLADRVRFVLDVAREEEVDVLILGAFGCGVFGQNPSEVARLFKTYLETTHKCFDKVVFAIPDGKNSNLEEFRRVFRKC